jgi:hypothetical protein
MVAGVANAQKQYRKLQIGKETTYGIEVAATRMLRILGLTWNDLGSNRQYIGDYNLGRMSMHSDVGSIIRSGVMGRVETDFSFEDILFALNAGFMTDLTGAEVTVGQGDYRYDFKLDPNTGDPTPTSWTLERQLSDGTTNWPATATGILVPQIEISVPSDPDVTKLAYDFWGRAPNTNALAALSPPTPFTVLPGLQWKLYINDTWAAMDTFAAAPSYAGGAQKSTTLRSFTWRRKGGIDPALYIGAGQIDPQGFNFKARGVELEMEVEFNAVIEAERLLAATSGSKRYVRLLGEGARIGTGYNKTILLQGSYIYPDGGFGEIGRDADGTEIVTLRLETVADDDAEDCEVIVVNTLSTFP